MEKSANWGFNLPNSGNDEIADINVISENFRTIDKVMNETDQTFEPESTKAASGKAVKEAIDGIQPIGEDTEFIFDGGDASGAISVDIVVDSALSKTSTNAIQNKAVATRIDELVNAIEQAKTEVLLSTYPIGAIYISVTNTDPATLFGGTWTAVHGRFLLASGENEENPEGSTYTLAAGAINTTAGDMDGEWKHTLTIPEMPKHSHNAPTSVTATGGTSEVGVPGPSGYDYNPEIPTSETGGNLSHNNMPPYLSVYMWKRTA